MVWRAAAATILAVGTGADGATAATIDRNRLSVVLSRATLEWLGALDEPLVVGGGPARVASEVASLGGGFNFLW